MNTERIALFLSGKLSNHYKAPFDKLELLEIVSNYFPQSFLEDLFKMTNAECFYSAVINKVARYDSANNDNNLLFIIDELKIPENISGVNSITQEHRSLSENADLFNKRSNDFKNLNSTKMEFGRLERQYNYIRSKIN